MQRVDVHRFPTSAPDDVSGLASMLDSGAIDPGNVIAVLLSLWNWYRRYELGEAAVVPTGLLISLVVVLILLYTGWRGWEMVYKHKVAVFD